MRPKFYADENVPLAISKALKRIGIDVLTARDAQLLGYSDREQLSFAVKENRAIITHDSDFLALIRNEKTHYQGVLFFTRQVKIGEGIEEIERIYLTYSAEELQGLILFLPIKE